MKSKLPSFLSGVVVALLLVALPVTALAASGAIKIEVSPIQVMVDGEVFQPKDVNGNDVIGRMNEIQARAREIVNADIIYN